MKLPKLDHLPGLCAKCGLPPVEYEVVIKSKRIGEVTATHHDGTECLFPIRIPFGVPVDVPQKNGDES